MYYFIPNFQKCFFVNLNCNFQLKMIRKNKFSEKEKYSKMGGSEKAKQKKAERKAMEKKMNEGFANVKLANSKV